MTPTDRSVFIERFGKARAIEVGIALFAITVVGFVLLQTAETHASDMAEDYSSSDFLTRAGGSAITAPARIRYQDAAGTQTLDNGESMILPAGTDVAITVNPYPPADFDIDVELRLTDAAGAPVVGATIESEWDMAFMPHGPFHTAFEPVGEGRYSASFDLFMFGPWQFVTTVAAPGATDPETLTFSIYTWPE